MDDIRWRQRYDNFGKAFKRLEQALSKKEFSDLEKTGVIKTYEFTFELGWKTLKDYLESKDVLVKFPREVIKTAFQHEIITNGEVWIDMLEKRNLMAHTYNETDANLAFELISKQYLAELQQIYLTLRTNSE
jgi:nucleotidyltransferase substrate binding protein (TIGR01987 family)